MKSAGLTQLTTIFPLAQDLIALKETTRSNPATTILAQGLSRVDLTADDMQDVHTRLQRFASYLAGVFPETAANGGIIESEVVATPATRRSPEQRFSQSVSGDLLLRRDGHLPTSGPIKARGGIYEALTHVGKLALEVGLPTTIDNYHKLLISELKQPFSWYSIAVGSIGNLGTSTGIMNARIGLKVTVHMSADTQAQKKVKLYNHDVTVIEYEEDYGVTIEQRRKAAESDPNRFFIDDKNSRTLFFGYAVTGERLGVQFAKAGRVADVDHPPFVYLPYGAGNGPSSVVLGLKLAFDDHVHCLFVEPTHSPCMLFGVHTGLRDQIVVQNLGANNLTTADGLAVGRASGFVGRAMERLLDRLYIPDDQTMYDILGWLTRVENIYLKPFALAGMVRPQRACVNQVYYQLQGPSEQQLEQITCLVWTAGGGAVPEEEIAQYLAKGR